MSLCTIYIEFVTAAYCDLTSYTWFLTWEHISLLRCQQSTEDASPTHLPNAEPRPTQPPPAPHCPGSIYLKMAVPGGAPCRRAILHVDDAWAGKTCNRCHPMRPHPGPFVPEQEWEWERPQGSCWPGSRVHHTNRLTQVFSRQNRAWIELYSTIFLFLTCSGSAELINRKSTHQPF